MRLPSLVAAVDRALRASGMPARGSALVVGLSGGADSVALTDALAALRRRRGFRLVAAHLDHGLRSGSADDAEFCAELCRRLDVPFRRGEADVRARAARERGGLEQVAVGHMVTPPPPSSKSVWSESVKSGCASVSG